MPVCIVKLCKNNTTRNKKDSGITYHQFPADPDICDHWTAIVRLSRQESWWKPGKRTVICSAHFNENDWYFTKCERKRLCKGAVPQNGLFLSSTPLDNISDKSAVTAKPSTSAPVVKEPIVTTGNETPPIDDSPDIGNIFNTPGNINLKKKLRRKRILQLKHARIIKTLREKVRRLQESNRNFINIIKSLMKEKANET